MTLTSIVTVSFRYVLSAHPLWSSSPKCDSLPPAVLLEISGDSGDSGDGGAEEKGVVGSPWYMVGGYDADQGKSFLCGYVSLNLSWLRIHSTVEWALEAFPR